VRQSTPSRQGAWKARLPKPARVIKPTIEINSAWKEIMDRRRLAEPNDTLPIRDKETLKDMYNAWMHEWCDTSLREDQQRKYTKREEQFLSFISLQQFGGKHIVMAMWQTGMQRATTSEKLRDDHEGALVHIAQKFAKWIQRVARAVTRHKKDIDTEEARRTSGSYGKHGLTDEELRMRQERLKARQNFHWALGLDRQLSRERGKVVLRDHKAQ